MNKSIPFTLLGIGLFILFIYSKDLVYLENKNETKTLLPTGIPYLDVIVSGPVEPNAAEMVMSDSVKELIIEELKMKYDYMNLDTPPVGFVLGEFELGQNSDVILFMVRQNFSKKEIFSQLNTRVKRGELIM